MSDDSFDVSLSQDEQRIIIAANKVRMRIQLISRAKIWEEKTRDKKTAGEL